MYYTIKKKSFISVFFDYIYKIYYMYTNTIILGLKDHTFKKNQQAFLDKVFQNNVLKKKYSIFECLKYRCSPCI